MNISKIENSKQLPVPFNALLRISNDAIEIIQITLLSGETIENHKNTVDVVFFVLDGNATIEIDGQEVAVQKYDAIEVLANSNRAVRNNSESNFNLLVIKLLR